MRDLITLDAYRVDLPAEVLKRMSVISSVDPNSTATRRELNEWGEANAEALPSLKLLEVLPSPKLPRPHDHCCTCDRHNNRHDREQIVLKN
jgi:hypothetical protein